MTISDGSQMMRGAKPHKREPEVVDSNNRADLPEPFVLPSGNLESLVRETLQNSNETVPSPDLFNSVIDETSYFTEKSSEIARILLMAGAGLSCWLAGGPDAKSVLSGIRDSTVLLLTLCFSVIGLALDAAHYLFVSIAYGSYEKVLEKVLEGREQNTSSEFRKAWKKLRFFGVETTLPEADEVTRKREIDSVFATTDPHPKRVVSWTGGFFFAKAISLAVTYLLLLIAIVFGAQVFGGIVP